MKETDGRLETLKLVIWREN